MNESASVAGLRILVVEDSYLVAIELSGQLEDLACEVIGPVATVQEALKRIDGLALDGALLDVNLNGEMSFPLADVLADRGIPFIFLTGYDGPTMFPRELQQAPRLSKPIDPRALITAVAENFSP